MASRFTIEANITDMFFDRKKVLEQIGRENARKLSKAGAFIRQRGKTKLRRRKTPARAGQPPSVHSKDSVATLKNIQFALNRDWESVVIGPIGLRSRRLVGSSADTVPELQEFGGTGTVRNRRVSYDKHPFMGPALQEEAAAGTISDLWKS